MQCMGMCSRCTEPSGPWVIAPRPQIWMDELASDIGDIRDAQDTQAQVVAESRHRADRFETVLAEAPPFDEIVKRPKALEERPLPSAPVAERFDNLYAERVHNATIWSKDLDAAPAQPV